MTGEDKMQRSEPARTLRTGHRGHRRINRGTVLARVMTERGLKKRHLSIVLQCSERHLSRYFEREYPLPTHRHQEVEDLLDMSIEEVIDDRGFLRLDA